MHKFFSHFVLFVLLGFLANNSFAKDATPAQGNAQARQYIDKMVGAYKKLTSYSGSVIVSAHLYGQPPMPATQATIQIQKPQFAAIHVKDGLSNSFAVFDGKTLFVTDSKYKTQYLKQPLSKGLGIMRVLSRAGMTGPGLTLLFTQPDALKMSAPPSSLSLGKETKVSGVPVATVISKTQQGKDSSILTYQIGKTDYLLRKVTLEQTVSGKSITMVETHTNIKLNPKLLSSTFSFKPAKGMKAVNRFTSP